MAKISVGGYPLNINPYTLAGAVTSLGLDQMRNFVKSKYGRKRRKTSKITTIRKVTTKLKNPTRSRIKLKKRKKTKINFKKLNVKNDVDKSTKTVYTQKVTRRQQRRINRKMRLDTNPYIRNYDNAIVETVPQQTNTCKWLWRTHSTLSNLTQAWDNFINNDTVQPYTSNHNLNSNMISEDMAIYFYKFYTKYEILNPTNYDMHLVIYDIVCKDDTEQDSVSGYSDAQFIDAFYQSKDNPIGLIHRGTQGFTTSSNTNVVEKPTNIKINDIAIKPTDSYPFNIHYTIVGKKTVTLQPGASMYHHFIYKPKNLMTRGYWGYKYRQPYPNNIAVKGFTCGTLFKYWGQLSGDTTTYLDADSSILQQSNPSAVVNLSGRLMLKEFHTQKWYCCKPKARYIQNTSGTTWRPTDEEQLPVVNAEMIVPAQDEDIVDGGTND